MGMSFLTQTLAPESLAITSLLLSQEHLQRISFKITNQPNLSYLRPVNGAKS